MTEKIMLEDATQLDASANEDGGLLERCEVKKVTLGPARPPSDWLQTEKPVNDDNKSKEEDQVKKIDDNNNEQPKEEEFQKPPKPPQSFPTMAWSTNKNTPQTSNDGFAAPTFGAPKRISSDAKNPSSNNNNNTDETQTESQPQSESSQPNTKDESNNLKLEEEAAKPKSEFPDVPYKEPKWSAPLKHPYRLEVMKNGAVIDEFVLKDKAHFVVGRLPNCDIVMEHNSCSRYHAILQCGDDGHVYVYDLGSTHGTRINKNAVASKKHFRLRLGHMVKFGMSTRLFLLQGNDESMKDEQQRLEDVALDVAIQKLEDTKEKEKKDAEGASWGMGYELEEELNVASELETTTKALDSNAYYLEDPKKALRVYFEREAAALNYEVEQDGPGHARIYTCRIRLPVDSSDGDSMVAEASVSGKKKEAIAEAAMIACKMLDQRGVLRNDGAKAVRKAKRQAIKDEENSDDDTFYDRSGQVEAKKRRKLKKAAAATETFESLSTKKDIAVKELMEIQAKQSQARKLQKKAEEDSGLDPLDAFINGMADNIGDDSKLKLKQRERVLQREVADLEHLLSFAAPAAMPT